MLTKADLWERIKTWLKILPVALLMTTVLNFLGPYLDSPTKTPVQKEEIEKVQPLPGHWLKTKEDSLSRKEEELALEEPAYQPEPIMAPSQGEGEIVRESEEVVVAPSPKSPEEVPHNNKKLNNTNVIFMWTDGAKLKAVNVMSINEETKRGGVIAVPLFTKVQYGGAFTTIEDVFKDKGRQGVTSIIEQYMEINIGSHVLIDQGSFIKISDIIGDIDIKGEAISIANAFEQTRTGQRQDDQAVVQAVTKTIIRPDMLIKVPQIIWVVSREVKTNLGTEAIMAMYQLTRNTDVDKMRKNALPGRDYIEGNKRYREVPEHAWKNMLYDLTT